MKVIREKKEKVGEYVDVCISNVIRKSLFKAPSRPVVPRPLISICGVPVE